MGNAKCCKDVKKKNHNTRMLGMQNDTNTTENHLQVLKVKYTSTL